MKNSKDVIEKKGPIAWMAGNSVASNLLMLVLLVGGLFWGLNMKQEVFPEFNMDRVLVTVAYPGASPEEVEKGIVLVIEEAVQGLNGVEEVTSSASEGIGTVVIEVIAGEDLQKLNQDIQSEIDRITSFPEEAEEPVVSVIDRKHNVLSLAVYGDQNEKVLRETAESIRDELLQDKEITQVEISGTRPYEISISIKKEILRQYGLTLQEVASRIRNISLELPGGGIKTSGGEILLRMKERRDYGPDFQKIPIITNNDGSTVLLEDIATVIDGFEDNDFQGSYNGKNAVMIDVYRVGEQTPLTVAKAVEKHMNELNQTLPGGIKTAILNDMSDIFGQRMDLLTRNGYIGLGLVLIMLGLFLEARLAFWVTMGIPISFLGSMLLLPLMGVSINMISMFAYIIALGIVVDDAVVVGENVYHYHQQGYRFLEAAIKGAREVAVPVIFSVLTNIVAFLPIAFVPGIMGKFLKTIPFVVITVFSISLIECLLVLPAHLGHGKENSTNILFGWLGRLQQRFSFWFIRMVNKIYGPFLDLTLRIRYITVAAGLTILILVLGYIASGRMGLTMFPKVESDFAIATAVLPYGSAVEKSKLVEKKLLDAAQKITAQYDEGTVIKGIYSSVGGSTGGEGESGTSGSHVVSIRVYMADVEIRTLSTDPFVQAWRTEVGDLMGLESLSFSSDSGGPGSGSALTVELSHRNIETLEKASAELAEALRYYPKVKDIDDGFSPGKQQLDFTMRPEGEALGLTSREVASQIRNSYYGAEALRQQRARNEIKVMVRLPKEQRISEYDLEEFMLTTPSGKEILLRQAVNVERGRAYTTINRRNGRRIVSVTSDVNPPEEANNILTDVKANALAKLLKKYPDLSYSFEGKQADMRDSMVSLMKGLLAAMLMIYVLLAIPFRSYIQPLIIMLSIPFGIVGAVIGHLIMGYSLSIMSMFGIVALAGVVVNDSLVLIDFANRRKQAGLKTHNAIHAAGVQRFRPIMLTTITTFGGLAPMIMEKSMQARFLIPMAISLGFGIVFSTAITLVLVPSLYTIVEDIRSLFGFSE